MGGAGCISRGEPYDLVVSLRPHSMLWTAPLSILPCYRRLLLAAVVVKFCLLCELYSRNKKELSKSEKQELLEYCRGR